MEKVFILTEGGKNIGFGHITRCISLYQAFKEKGIIPEFIVNGDNSILNLLSDKKHQMFNWIKQKGYLFEHIKNADIVIIDSYLATKDIYDKISDLVKVPVYLDDNKRINYPKGIVVNGSIYAEQLDYPQNDGITYLLGTKYTPLRKEFWDVPEKEIKKEVESVMVTFGGDDMRNMTPKFLKLLIEEFPELKKNVIIGKSFKNVKEIEKLKDNKTKLYYSANAETMKNIMLESDIVISAAGQTTYELAATMAPTIGIGVADNQMTNIKGWVETGFLEFAGWWNSEKIKDNMISIMKFYKEYENRCKKFEIARDSISRNGAENIIKVIL